MKRKDFSLYESCIIHCTIDNPVSAERIADFLLEQRLVSCVQIEGPFESRYWWKGKLEKTIEWRLVIKTMAEMAEKACGEIRKLHPYEIPEIVILPVTGGNPDYLKWIADETAGKTE